MGRSNEKLVQGMLGFNWNTLTVYCLVQCIPLIYLHINFRNLTNIKHSLGKKANMATRTMVGTSHVSNIIINLHIGPGSSVIHSLI